MLRKLTALFLMLIGAIIVFSQLDVETSKKRGFCRKWRKGAVSFGIIGGADGPTSIFISKKQR